jgi:DNA polymerase III sliding clamp (beta) subunit (PCNA family)
MSKFSVRVNDPKGFSRAFKLAAGCASHGSKWGNKLPVQDVLLRVAGFKALLLATDLCQYLTIDLGLADCGQLSLDGGDGELFLPAGWKVPREPFTLEYEPTDTGPKVTLKYGAVETEISQESNPDHWPNFPLRNAGCKFDLPAARLAHELSTLAPMCQAEKGRYALNGIFFEFSGTKPEDAGPFFHYLPPFKAHLVATDGKHLGMTTLPVTFEKPPRYQALLEHTHALNVSKIMLALENDENVEVAFSPEVEETNDKGETQEVRPAENVMFFGTRSWSYTARMIEGQFPDWHSVVPKTDATVLLDREAFIEAVQAVKHACDVESTAVKLTFNADHLLIEAKSHKNGYAKTQILLDEVPPQMQLGLDPEYLIEACTALTGDTIVFQFRSCEYGVSIHDGAPELRYQLVMPIDFSDRPTEPKEPKLDIKEEVWNGNTRTWDKVSDEAKALAQAEYDKALEKHKQDLEAYKVELARWRLNNRRNATQVDGEDSDEEQKPGEFTPRPADSPQIGQKLGHVPTLDELHAKALTAKGGAPPTVLATELATMSLEARQMRLFGFI